MASWTVHLDGHTATVNELLRSVKARIRLKRRDRQWLALACRAAGVPRATGRRRVSLTLVYGPRARRHDPDGFWKSVLDALVKAGALKNDSPGWCELGEVLYVRGKRAAMRILIEDVEAKGGEHA